MIMFVLGFGSSLILCLLFIGVDTYLKKNKKEKDGLIKEILELRNKIKELNNDIKDLICKRERENVYNENRFNYQKGELKDLRELIAKKNKEIQTLESKLNHQ